MKKTKGLVLVGMCLILAGCEAGSSGIFQEEYDKSCYREK